MSNASHPLWAGTHHGSQPALLAVHVPTLGGRHRLHVRLLHQWRTLLKFIGFIVIYLKQYFSLYNGLYKSSQILETFFYNSYYLQAVHPLKYLPINSAWIQNMTLYDKEHNKTTSVVNDKCEMWLTMNQYPPYRWGISARLPAPPAPSAWSSKPWLSVLLTLARLSPLPTLPHLAPPSTVEELLTLAGGLPLLL